MKILEDGTIVKRTWKESYELPEGIKKEDVLNGMPLNEVSDLQQMLYHTLEKIELLEARIKELEGQ